MTSRNLGASLMLLILAQLMVYCLLRLLSSYMCATNHLNRCRVYIFSLLSCSFARRSHLRWRDQMLTRPTLTFSALSLSISSLDLCLICPSWWLLLLPRLGDGRLRGWMVCRTTGRVRNCCTISRVGYPYSVNAHSISWYLESVHDFYCSAPRNFGSWIRSSYDQTSGGKSGFEKLPTDRLNSVIALGL